MELKVIKAKDFKELNHRNRINLIDVSKPDKFDAGSIPNSINVPYKVFKTAYQSFASKEKPNYVTSNNGRSGKKAAKLLAKKGYDVTFIEGGSDAYGLYYSLVRVIKKD